MRTGSERDGVANTFAGAGEVVEGDHAGELAMDAGGESMRE